MGGKLIVIEGSDASGKKTQYELLVKKLKEHGYDVQGFDFPRYDSKWGKKIKDYLDGKYGNKTYPYEISKLYANDRLEVREDILNSLKKGYKVVCNRYIQSNKAHQAAKLDGKQERNKFIRWLDDLEYKINGMPKEDIFIFLNVPTKISQQLMEKRNQKKDMHETDVKYLEMVRQIYLELATNEKGHVINCINKGKLLSIEDISSKVYRIVNRNV